MAETTIKRLRWRKVHLTAAGKEFVIWNGARWYLDNFEYTRQPGWDGATHISNTGGLLIRLSRDQERAQLALIY